MKEFEAFIWIAWDLLAIFVFFHFIRDCAKKGLISTLIKALVYIGAALAADKLYLKISGFLYDNFMRVVVQHILTRNFNEMLSYGGGSEKNILEAIPLLLKLLLGGNRAAVSAIPLADEADILASSVIDMFLETPMITVLHAISFLFVFTVVSFAIRRLARIFISVNRIPVIGWLNVLLGGILGVFVGGAALFVAAFALRIAVTMSGGWWLLNPEVMDATYIWRVFWR